MQYTIIEWVPLRWEPDTFTILDLFHRMHDGNGIHFGGKVLMVSGISRESGGRPCTNWLILLSDGNTYYWNESKGRFSAKTASRCG